jgi:hypothetical protein
MRIDVYHHDTMVGEDVVESLRSIRRLLHELKLQGVSNMSTSTELVVLAQAIADEVAKFAPAVDALEAAVTAALAQVPGGVPPAVQADIDAAVAILQGVADNATKAVADAADGLDEAKVV